MSHGFGRFLEMAVIPPSLAAWPQIQDFFGTPLVIELSAGQLATGAGRLPVRLRRPAAPPHIRP
jgi:hypothetical protein